MCRPLSGHLKLNLVILIKVSNNLVYYEDSFVYTQLNVKTVLFQTLQFSIKKFFGYQQLNGKTVNFDQFCLA